MTAPQPTNPPLTAHVCAAWAQPGELPPDAQALHTEGTWCAILGFTSDILWAASGRRWRNVQATETVTLDPTCNPCGNSSWMIPDRWGYGWALLPSPGRPDRVRLPRPDVTSITTVTLGGSSFTDYRLRGSWAIRTDGCGWPLANTTLITYEFGRLIDDAANLAAILLGTELGKAMAGKSCGLPARVTSVTRQGVSFDALESLEVLKEGLTGLHAVDLWLQNINPHRVGQNATIWSPDLTEARRA